MSSDLVVQQFVHHFGNARVVILDTWREKTEKRRHHLSQSGSRRRSVFPGQLLTGGSDHGQQSPRCPQSAARSQYASLVLAMWRPLVLATMDHGYKLQQGSLRLQTLPPVLPITMHTPHYCTTAFSALILKDGSQKQDPTQKFSYEVLASSNVQMTGMVYYLLLTLKPRMFYVSGTSCNRKEVIKQVLLLYHHHHKNSQLNQSQVQRDCR